MTDRKPKAENSKTKQTFKPNANYEWDENQEFTILGSELNIILKSLQIAADTPEYKRNVSIFQALSVVSNVFKESVEQGLIFESKSKDAPVVESEVVEAEHI